MANLRLAQIYKTSVAAIFDQFRITDGAFESLLLNRQLSLSWSEFQNVMQGQTVPFQSVTGLSYDLFTSLDWLNFTAEEWYDLMGSPTFGAAKVSLYLRVGGSPSDAFFVDDALTIDLTNHVAFAHGAYLLSRDDDAGSTGSGAMSCFGNYSSSTPMPEGDAPSMDYPVRFAQDVPYTLYFRVRSETAQHQFDVLIDGQTIAEFRSTATDSNYTWLSCTLLLPDDQKYTLSVRPRNIGCHLDKLVVARTGAAPSGNGPAYDPSPFVTTHIHLTQTDGQHLPTTFLKCYDAKNTLEHIIADDWYNFNTASRMSDASTTDDEYAVVVLTSGGSDGHFVMWDIASPSEGMPSASNDGSGWNIDATTNHAILLYSNKQSTSNCAVVARPAQDFDLWVRNFRPEDATLTNTRLTNDEYDPAGQVVLDTPKKLVNLLIDQSGSNTWNDPKGARFTAAERLVNRLTAAYPNDVAYNLFTFNSKPVRPVVFASTQNFRDGSSTSIAENFFLRYATTQAAGMRLVRKVGSFPQSPIDGEILKDGIFTRFRDTGLDSNTEYFYSVFTYDQNYRRFSPPRNISATPRTRNVPVGVSNFTVGALTGTGVPVDSSVVGVWHFREGQGSHVRDFSDASTTLSFIDSGPTDRPVWIEKPNVPVGYSGMRFNGTTQCLRSDVTLGGGVGNKFTLMAWVYWYGSGGGPIVTRENSSAINYYASLDSSGKLNVKTSSSSYATGTTALTANTWNHVAITVDLDASQAAFYINGVLDSTKVLASTTTNASDMKVSIGSNYAGNSFLFGRLTEISVHSVIRDGSYIAEAAAGNTADVQDNGDRIATFDWMMNEASAGTVQIVQNAFSSPANPLDGDVVYEKALTAGAYAASHSQRFRIGSDFYYRVFVRNSDGNYSEMEDAASGRLVVPYLPNSVAAPALSTPLTPPVSLSATAADKTVLLKWEQSGDYRATAVSVFVDTEAPPVVESVDVYSGTLVATLDSTVQSITVDKLSGVPLLNDKPYYFTVVSLTNFGQVSSGVSTTATPSADAPPLVVQPPAVKNLRYESVDETSVEIIWDSPVAFYQSADVYVGDMAYMYGLLMDEYGDAISAVEGLTINADGNFIYDAVQDVFGDFGTGNVTADAYDITSSVRDDGLVIGTVRFDNRVRAVNRVAKAVFTLKLSAGFTSPDGKQHFSYESDAFANVTYYSPLSVTVENLNRDKVLSRSRGLDGQITETNVDGAFARRDAPVSLRVTATYRGAPVSLLNLNTRQFRNYDIGGTVLEDAVQMSTTTGVLDISVQCPSEPQTLTFFARTAIGAYSRTNEIVLRFENPLRVEVTAKAPKNDGSDRVEQFAVAYYIDPNDSTIVSMVPNLTLVRWDCSASAQPFYSIDPTRQPNGVYSYVRNGTARKVFLGPVGNIPPSGENMNISAKIVYNGLVANDTVSIFVRGYNEELEFSGKRFLSEFPNPVNAIWADGKDYVKLAIIHDPNVTTSRFSDCFLTCSAQTGNDIIPLSAGQLVQIITADDYEIIWGDVVEISDTGGDYVDTTSAFSQIGSATLPLSSGPVTYVYFRLNRFIDDTVPRATILSPSCSCVRGAGGYGLAASPIALQTSIFINGQTIPLRSGGASTLSVPSLVLDPKEPLDIRAVDLRVDGVPSDVFVIDGASSNVIVFEVTWRGGPVPDGSTVLLSNPDPTNTNWNVPFVATEIKTVTLLDPFLNPNGPLRSFAFATVQPMSPSSSFSFSFKASSTYDESGTVARLSEALVSISYNSLYEPDRQSQVISDGFHKYAVATNTWSSLPSLPHRRGALSLSYANGAFYAIGGTNGRSISVFNEKYDGTSWNSVADMPSPRAYAQTVVVGNSIYVLGGLTSDGLSDTFIVSRAVERYDTESNTWTSLASMPTIDTGGADPRPYGVMMGASAYSSGYIYVLCGLTGVDGQAASHNDRVLRYDIANNVWTYSSAISGQIMESLTNRISPFYSVNGAVLHVLGGLRYVQTPAGQEMRTDAFSVSLGGSAGDVAASIAASDNDYREIPLPRYKGGSVSVGTTSLFLGGSSDEFPTNNSVESFDTMASQWAFQSLAGMPEGLHSFGVATDGTDVFVAGGMCSGRSADFLQINLSIPNKLRLDGRNTQTFFVDVRDRNNNIPSNVELLFVASVNGGASSTFVQAPEVVVPLLFTDRYMTIDGQVGTNVILPRSEDGSLSSSFYEVAKQGGIGDGDSADTPGDTFQIDAIVRDTFYRGRTTRPDALPDDHVDSGVISFGKNVTLVGSRIKNTEDRGVFVSKTLHTDVFDLLPLAMPAGNSTVLTTYSDIPWVPSVNTIVGNNAGTAQDVLDAVGRLRPNIPFGCSPLMDTIEQGVVLMQEDSGYGYSKVFYAFTDGVDNMSQTPLDTVITDLGSLVGSNEVPFIGIDLADQIPVMQSSSRDSGNNATMERIAAATGGQTISVINGDNLDGIVNDITGRLLGSVGHGLFGYVVDILELSLLKRVSLEFVLPTNSSATWKYALSDDGMEYSPWSEPLNDTDVAEFEGVTARYVKFLVSLTSGLTTQNTESQEATPSQSPSLDAINIVFQKSLSDYLFLTSRETAGNPEDVVLAVDADRPHATDLLVGVSTYDGTNWDRFNTKSSPAEDQNGKLVIPYRIFNESATKQESLVPLDHFMMRAQYGRWQPNAVVTIYNSSGTVVPADKYNVHPDTGTVTFKERLDNDTYHISIAEKQALKLGMKITSRSGDASVKVYGAGTMYTER